MAVFTALRNKAQSGLAGLVTGAAKSALGLNRAAGLRFPSGGGSKPGADTNLLFQYPLDLGSTGNNHFISFFVRERKAAKVTQSQQIFQTANLKHWVIRLNLMPKKRKGENMTANP
jgi:hypothetical protein